VNEEVLPDGARLELCPCAVEGECDERALRIDVVADDQQLESPCAGREDVRLVGRPGTADLDDDRTWPLGGAVEADRREVDDSVGMGKDVD
jgi:hypothetical protein